MSHGTLQDQSSPRISIGMPVYNGGKFLEASLDSILGQSYRDFELIISDNASTDNTADICSSYAQRDHRIRIHSQSSNLGAAENYNFVYSESQGTYFKWAAADDLCATTMLDQYVKVLDSNPDVVVVYANTLIIDEDSNIVRGYEDRLSLSSDDPAARFRKLIRVLRECNAIFGLIRSETLAKTPLIGKYPNSDGCLLAELCLHGKFHEISAPLFLRRDHPAASSADRSLDKQMEFFAPDLVGRVSLPRGRRRLENLKSVTRTSLSVRVKIELFVVVVNTLCKDPVFWRELRAHIIKSFRRMKKTLTSPMKRASQ